MRAKLNSGQGEVTRAQQTATINNNSTYTSHTHGQGLRGIVFGSSRLVAIGGWLSLSAGVNRGAVATALRLGVTRQAVPCVARTHLLGCPHEWVLMTHWSGRGPATLPLQCQGRPSDLESNKRGYSTPSPQTIRPSPPRQKYFTCARVGGVRVQHRNAVSVRCKATGGRVQGPNSLVIIRQAPWLCK